MGLSNRATGFLATLTRKPPVPLDEVAAALERAGCPPCAKWLDYHARYAGYVEAIHRETAVWGIVHATGSWLAPHEAEVERLRDGRWRVVCADVHPSFDYFLGSEGEFFSSGDGGPFETFDVRVEALAVYRETVAGDRHWRRDLQLAKRVKEHPADTRDRWGLELVPETSDRYGACWRSSDALVLTRGGAVQAWVAVDECRP